MEDSNSVKTPIETRIKLTKEGNERTIYATYFKQIVVDISRVLDPTYVML